MVPTERSGGAGINRLGNLLVPNKNYCNLEDWIMPILDEMLEEQREKHVVWTPSKMIRRFGERIDNPDSVWYWAAKVSARLCLSAGAH